MDGNVALMLRLAWTIIGIVGFVFTVGEVIECQRDFWAVHRATDYNRGGGKDIVVHKNRRDQIGRGFLLGVFATVGLLALTMPTPNRPISPLGLAIGLAFIVGELVMSVGAYLDRGDRIRLLGRVHDRRRDDTKTEGTAS